LMNAIKAILGSISPQAVAVYLRTKCMSSLRGSLLIAIAPKKAPLTRSWLSTPVAKPLQKAAELTSVVVHLTGFLDLHFNVPMPPSDDTEAAGAFISQRMMFNKFQRAYEDALLKAI